MNLGRSGARSARAYHHGVHGISDEANLRRKRQNCSAGKAVSRPTLPPALIHSVSGVSSRICQCSVLGKCASKARSAGSHEASSCWRISATGFFLRQSREASRCSSRCVQVCPYAASQSSELQLQVQERTKASALPWSIGYVQTWQSDPSHVRIVPSRKSAQDGEHMVTRSLARSTYVHRLHQTQWIRTSSQHDESNSRKDASARLGDREMREDAAQASAHRRRR